MSFGSIDKTVGVGMAEAEAQVREALAGQGFGVLTEIDVAATLQAKLGIERSPLKILGACNPGLAHQALEADPSAGLVLPCNVVLRAMDGGETMVSAVDPRELLTDEVLRSFADEAAALLKAALDSLPESRP